VPSKSFRRVESAGWRFERDLSSDSHAARDVQFAMRSRPLLRDCRITCHRNESTEKRRRDTGINTKSMINWPVRRRAREVGVERHLLRAGIATYIQRPIVARTGSQATFCFPRFWISSSSSSSSSSSQLLHSTGQVHEIRAHNCTQHRPCGINSNRPKYPRVSLPDEGFDQAVHL